MIQEVEHVWGLEFTFQQWMSCVVVVVVLWVHTKKCQGLLSALCPGITSSCSWDTCGMQRIKPGPATCKAGVPAIPAIMIVHHLYDLMNTPGYDSSGLWASPARARATNLQAWTKLSFPRISHSSQHPPSLQHPQCCLKWPYFKKLCGNSSESWQLLFSAHSWICTPGSLLAWLAEPYVILGIKTRSAEYK